MIDLLLDLILGILVGWSISIFPIILIENFYIMLGKGSFIDKIFQSEVITI